MAFDMYMNQHHVAIEQHEISLFQYINEKKYPVLNWLWVNYYESPVIHSENANKIVHELIHLKTIVQEHKSILNTINKLLPFFSKAYTSSIQVECSSD